MRQGRVELMELPVSEQRVLGSPTSGIAKLEWR